MTKIAIIGAAGKMGRRLVALARQHDCEVVSAIVAEAHQLIGEDAGEHAGIGRIGVAYSSEMTGDPQVLVDFSSPEGMRHWLHLAAERGIAVVIGTTGLSDEDHALIDSAAQRVAVLQSPNMSLGVAVLTELVRRAADALRDEGSDVEIVEAHHRTKKDAPSGTALALARATGRDAIGNLPVHSLRIGDEVGTHTVFFALQGERLELTHRATNRDTFARGALRSAVWLAQQEPGRYTMADVLGMKTT